MRESEVARQCDVKLRAAGWELIKLSQDVPTRKQSAGITDRIALRHGYNVYVEYKAPGEQLRPSQIKFYARIGSHLGEYVRYYVIDHPDKIPQWMLKDPRKP